MYRRIAALALGLGLVLQPVGVLAQTPLERLEALDERMNAVIVDALVAQIPDLAGNVPPLDWDAQMRANGACLLDAVETQAGPGGVADLLEAYAATVNQAAGASVDLGGLRLDAPEGMSATQFQAAYAGCGMLDWLSSRLAASGALEIILNSSR